MILGLLNALILFVHRVMTSGDNLDYLFIAGCVLAGDLLEPFKWRFPVAYPYLIAGFSKLAGITIGTNPLTISSAAMYAIQLLGCWMAPLSVLAVWWWGRAVLPGRNAALAITALFATSQHVAPQYSVIGAEPFFILLSWLSLWGWERSWGSRSNEKAKCLAMASVCTLFAILFRQISLAIPVAVIAAFVWVKIHGEGKGTVGPVLGAALILTVGILIMVFSNPSHLNQLSSSSHGSATPWDWIEDKIVLFLGNANIYRLIIPQVLLAKVFGSYGLLELAGLSWFELPLAMLVYGVFMMGVVELFIKRQVGLITVMYVVVSIVIFLLWPYTDGRFFIPLLPALWLVIITGIRRVVGMMRLSGPTDRIICVSSVALLLVWQIGINAYAGMKNVRAMHEFRDLPAWHPSRYERTGELDFADHLACGLWLSQHAERKALVYGEKPGFLGLASGRETVYLWALTDILKSGVWKEDYTVHYAVVDSFPATAGYGKSKLDFINEISRRQPPYYDLVFEGPHGAKVYKRRMPDSGEDGSVITTPP